MGKVLHQRIFAYKVRCGIVKNDVVCFDNAAAVL